MKTNRYNYGTAILSAFEYLLKNYKETFVIGQGLWSPWYVGDSMTDLDKKFGKNRVIDTPVSESACTGAGVGASIAGMRPVVIHPRMDFMLYAMDAIVNQAAKWSSMTGGQAHPSVTFRGIINRGGEQGAQHSQALHAWFAHVPGLRVVMPASVKDARDLLIASVLCDDPVMFIDDRWLYDQEANLPSVELFSLEGQGPAIARPGNDLTIIACGYGVRLAEEASKKLRLLGIDAEVIDIRILNPLKTEPLICSVEKTGRMLVVDTGTRTAGYAGEIIASICEKITYASLFVAPKRVTLPDAPAPSSIVLEKAYYTSVDDVVLAAMDMF